MFTLVYFLFLSTVVLAFTREQKIQFNGQVICNNKPVSGAKVYLRERDQFSTDDTLAKTRTNETGHFYLKGIENEYFTIQPYILVVHTCDIDGKDDFCIRVAEYNVPSMFINKVITNTHVINLNKRGKNDKKLCSKDVIEPQCGECETFCVRHCKNFPSIK